MSTKLILAALTSIALSACVAGSPDDGSIAADDEHTGEAVGALQGIEHVQNRDLALPAGQSQSTFEVPVFYAGNSSPFQLSLSNTVLYWHGQFSTPGNNPNPGTLNSYVRFVHDAPGAASSALLSVSPGVTSGLVQAFASYRGGTPVTGPSRISTRVMILSGDVKLHLANVNGLTKCSVQSDASTPRGVWTTLATDCPAPAAGDPNWMVELATASDTGAIAMVDWISVME